MALLNTDLFLVERSGVKYNLTADQIATFVGAVKDLTATSYANMLAGTFVGGATAKTGDRVFVADATGDASVVSGWAIYRISTVLPIVVNKIQEQEGLDLVISTVTNLSYTPSPTGGVVESDNGTDANIPLVNGTNAGLASPSMFNNEHPKAFSGLNAQTNPININPITQEVTFNITQLTPLP